MTQLLLTPDPPQRIDLTLLKGLIKVRAKHFPERVLPLLDTIVKSKELDDEQIINLYLYASAATAKYHGEK